MSFIQIPIGTYPNTFLGYQSSDSITVGSGNTALGIQTLTSGQNIFGNTAIGTEALERLISGANNTAVGQYALQSVVNAGFNTAVGQQSLILCTEAYNTAIGYSSGSEITTGFRNTILGPYNGNQGGLDIRTAAGYVVLSDGYGNPRLWVDPTGLVTAPGGFSGGGGGGALTFNNKTAAYTVVSGDLGEIVNCTANTFTVSLTAAATLGAGFNCWVWNTGTGVITIDPNGAETIDGTSTLTLRQGEGTQIVCNGTNWETGSKKTMRAYAENMPSSVTRPSASGSSSIAIGRDSSSSGGFSVSTGYGASSPGTSSFSAGYFTTAAANQSTAIGANSASQGSSTSGGAGAMALGGSYASGTDSFSAAVANNTSSYGARAAGSIALGDRANAPGSKAIAIGQLSTSSGNNTIAIGGNCEATINYATAIGFYAKADTIGKYAYASSLFSATGDCQTGTFVLSRASTNNTPVVLTSDSSAPGTNNQVILPNNSAYAFTGTVVARQQATGGTQSAAWKIEGLIRREANAASTTLVASTVTAISNVPGWTLALSADTANGGLAITATGAVGTNIRWVATVATSEVNYA